MAVTVALYGDSGAGKTTQLGEFAKYRYKQDRRRLVLATADRGGYGSIEPLVKLGVVEVNEFGPEDDPWIWIDRAVSGPYGDQVGAVAFDSGTSYSEALLSACSHSDFQVGQQRTQKFVVSKGKENLTVAINNEAHYGVVQGFMLDAIWKSTWLTKRDIDVLWTFSVHRGEEQDRTPILGPKLAGKALTAAIPKWFNYTFRVASCPVDGGPPRHVLYTAEHAELAGLGHSFGNARYPLAAQTELPAEVEPASLVTVFELIDQGKKEAEDALRLELGL